MLKMENVSKAYGSKKVLDHVSLNVEAGEIVCLMGKSGAGKTTLLRCLNQLETMDDGRICLDDLTLVSKKGHNPLFQQQVGLVFQGYHLFEHWTILRNCMDAPVYQKMMSRQEAEEKALMLLDKMGILAEKDCYPRTLSGGQKQRAAIVRACMLNPKVLCFDEPTSALDQASVQQVSQMIRGLAQEGMAIFIVSHDEQFAKQTADRIVWLEDGRLQEKYMN